MPGDRPWPPVRLPALAAAAAAGIALSSTTAWAAQWPPWLIAAAVVAALPRAPRAPRWLAVAALAAAALAAVERAPAAAPPHAIADDRALDTLVGHVTGPIASTRRGDGFVLDTDPGRVWVQCTGPSRVLPGDRVRVEGRLVSPRGYRNPGGADRARTVRERGADWELSARHLDVIAPADRWSPWRWPARVARRGAAAVRARGGDPVGNALVRGAVLGDRAGLDDDTDRAWRAAGVYHALCVSGLHLAAVALVGFVAGGWLWAGLGLGWLGAPRRAGAALALPLSVAYTLVTGAHVATVRALVVAVAVLTGELIGRRARAADALGLAALVVLAARPSALADPGFQLSFAAAATLIAAARGRPGRSPRRPWWRRVLAGAARALATSCAVALATAPITALHFHEVSLGGALGNLVVTPLVELVVIPLGLIGLAVGALPGAAAAGGLAIDGAVAVAGAAARLVDGLASITPLLIVPPPSPVELGGAAGLWCAWALVRRGRVRGRRALAVAALAAALLCGSWARRHHQRHADDTLRVTFLDVGQGDAAVIELPHGAVWLVDTGGAPGAPGAPGAGAGERWRTRVRPGQAVARYLRARRVDRVDVVVLSHPHPDHYLGLAALARQVAIDELWLAAPPAALDPARDGPGELDAIVAWLAARGTRVVHPTRGRHWLGDVAIDVLAPIHDPGDGPRPEAAADPVRTVNDNSLVIAVERAGRRVLFAGDLEHEGEAALVAAVPDLAADVVKVAHHGSATSSGPALVAATHPGWAVMSLGRANRFGFPAAAVVERWRAAGARVVRTDQVGAVTVTIDRAGHLAVATLDRGPAGDRHPRPPAAPARAVP